MKKIIISSLDEKKADDLFICLREFNIHKMVLFYSKGKENAVKKIKDDFAKFKVAVEPIVIDPKEKDIGSLFKYYTDGVNKLIKSSSAGEMVINLSPGSKLSSCILLSIAFVKGIEAFFIEEDKIVYLPVIRFPYQNLLTDKKLEIIKYLNAKKGKGSTLDELSKSLKMSLPLLSYHLNGSLKSDGLKDFGLVEVEEKKGKNLINLTDLGQIILNQS